MGKRSDFMSPQFNKDVLEFLKHFFRKGEPNRIQWLLLFSKMVAPLILIPFLLLFASIGEADYMAYKDATKPVEERVKDLLSRMTLAEKIGQMTQIERAVATPDVLKNYYIGTLSLCIFYFFRHYFRASSIKHCSNM